MPDLLLYTLISTISATIGAIAMAILCASGRTKMIEESWRNGWNQGFITGKADQTPAGGIVFTPEYNPDTAGKE